MSKDHPMHSIGKGLELYERFQVLLEQVKANPQDMDARREMEEIKRQVEGNRVLKAEFTQAAQAEKTTIVERSFDLGKVADTAGKLIRREEVPSSSPPVPSEASDPYARPAYGLQFNSPADVVEFWSDLVEGAGERREEFLMAYHRVMKERNNQIDLRPVSVAVSWGFSRKRGFVGFKWFVARAILQIEKMGNDLYVSWRVLVKPPVSELRIFAWLGLCVMVSIFFTVGFNFQVYSYSYGYSTVNPYFQTTLETCIKFVIVSAIFLALGGLFYRHGDVWGLLRRPFDEFDRDDAMIAAHIVHKNVLHAADAVGIDSTILAPRASQPVPMQERKRRI